MVFDGGGLARAARWRGSHSDHQFHRTLRSRARRSVSFRTRGGVGCGVVGSVAAPALVILGDGAAGRVHVRIDSVGAVSLRRGRVWGTGDGNAWVSDRTV